VPDGAPLFSMRDGSRMSCAITIDRLSPSGA